MREAVVTPAPARRRATRVAVDPAASRARWIEAFYVAEAKAQLAAQTSAFDNRRSTRSG